MSHILTTNAPVSFFGYAHTKWCAIYSFNSITFLFSFSSYFSGSESYDYQQTDDVER